MAPKKASQARQASQMRPTQQEEPSESVSIVIISSSSSQENDSGQQTQAQAGPSNRPPKVTQPTPAQLKRRRSNAAEQQGTQSQGKRRNAEARQPSQQHQGQEDQAEQEQVEQDDPSLPLVYPPNEVKALLDKVQAYENEYKNLLANTNLGQVKDEDIQTMIGAGFRFMLFAHYSKPGAAVEHSKVVTAFMEGFQDKNKRKLAPVVMAGVQYKLIEVAGLEMKEVKKQSAGNRARAPGTQESTTRYYRLHSALPSTVREALFPRDLSWSFIMPVLALIKFSGGKLSEERLSEYLSEVGVALASGPHAAPHVRLGKIHDLLNTMVTNRYLIKTKETSSTSGNPASTDMYQWGESALEEVGEQQVKVFFEQMCDGYKPAPVEPVAYQDTGDVLFIEDSL